MSVSGHILQSASQHEDDCILQYSTYFVRAAALSTKSNKKYLIWIIAIDTPPLTPAYKEALIGSAVFLIMHPSISTRSDGFALCVFKT